MSHLADYGYSVRTLLRPSQHSPDLPRGMAVDVTLASLTDRRGVRASLAGVDSVIHLADLPTLTGSLDRLTADVDGTRTIAEACADAGIQRLIYISLLGADRSSAYPSMRAKAIAEDHIQQSGVPYTILRTAVIFGRDDHFTVPLAMMLSAAPLLFPIPGDGSVILQPLWVEDLAAAIVWALDNPSTLKETFEIGGPEYHSFRHVLQMIMKAASSPRILFPMRSPYLRAAAWLMQRLMPRSPVNPLWLDYLAVNRSTDLNTLPSIFGLQPSRMEPNLSYLQERNWGWEFLRRQFIFKRGE